MTTRNQRWAIFDYDDTLGGVLMDGKVVPNYFAYDETIRRLGEAMEGLGFDRAEAVANFKAANREAAAKQGFGDRNYFPRAMEGVLHRMAIARGEDREFQFHHGNEIFKIGLSVFTAYPYTALEGALDVLDALRPHFQISVVTKGDPTEQVKKLARSGVLPYADHYKVVNDKCRVEWHAVLKELGMGRSFNPEVEAEGAALRRRSWAIGNSAKADVNPPLWYGMNAIHLNDPNGWAFEHAENERPHGGAVLVTVSDIRECLAHLPI